MIEHHAMFDFDRDHMMVDSYSIHLPDDFTGELNQWITLPTEGQADIQEVTICLTQLARSGNHPVWYCMREGKRNESHEFRADIKAGTGTLSVKQRVRWGGPADDIDDQHIRY